jgi:hypothetical protein
VSIIALFVFALGPARRLAADGRFVVLSQGVVPNQMREEIEPDVCKSAKPKASARRADWP